MYAEKPVLSGRDRRIAWWFGMTPVEMMVRVFLAMQGVSPQRGYTS